MLAWVDHNDADFGREVLGRLSALELRGARVQHYWTAEAPAAESDRRHRRNRITDAWRWFLREAAAPVILAAEDDTLPDADAYPRLLRHLQGGAVFAQGTCVARQLPYVPHWTVGQDEIRSASYDGREVVDIQGGGWYCAAMVTEAARSCLVVDEGFPLGPDVLFVRELARAGRCVGDWAVECGHFGQGFHLHPATSSLRQVVFRRRDERWQREEYEAAPFRQAAPKSEEGLLRVKVLKPFTGTPEEREKYVGPGRRTLEPGTIMEMSEERYQELGMRPNPLVVAYPQASASPGSSLASWAPVVKPAAPVEKAPAEARGSQEEPAEEPAAAPEAPPSRRRK